MKKILMASAATMALTGAALADGHGNSVSIGVILGFTGPIESITPAMADGAELAMAEVTESGALMGGMAVNSVRADSTCIDSSAANAAAMGATEPPPSLAACGHFCRRVGSFEDPRRVRYARSESPAC